MKYKYLLIILNVIVFCSCGTNYYCATMATNDDETGKNEYGEFLVEADSISVTYSFYGQNAPIRISIKNKMSTPVYVDWSKSGVMIDDTAMPYLETKHISKTDLVDFGYFLDHSDVVSYVKPNSSFSQQILELSNFNFQDIDDDSYQSWYTEADSRGDNKKYKAIRYTDENSPIYLRTFLAIYEDSMSVEEAYFYEIDFYMSELVKIKGSSLQKLDAIKQQRGDTFYVKEEKMKKPTKEKKNSPSIGQKLKSVTGKIEEWAVQGSRVSETN